MQIASAPAEMSDTSKNAVTYDATGVDIYTLGLLSILPAEKSMYPCIGIVTGKVFVQREMLKTDGEKKQAVIMCYSEGIGMIGVCVMIIRVTDPQCLDTCPVA
jgi:hypothetical protein